MAGPIRVVVFLLVFLLFRDEQQEGFHGVSSFSLSSIVWGRYRYSPVRKNRAAAFREALSLCRISVCRQSPIAYSDLGGSETPKHDDNDQAKAVVPSPSSAGTSVTLKLAMDEQGGVADLSCEKSERFTCPESLDMVRAVSACLVCLLLSFFSDLNRFFFVDEWGQSSSYDMLTGTPYYLFFNSN